MKNIKEIKDSRCEASSLFFSGALIGISLLSGAILASSTTSADVIDDIAITVPVSCNMTSELDEAHTATINPGQYQSDIGTTNFNVLCNDNSGYAIYAIGYSNEEYGNTKLLATVGGQLAPTYDIVTGTATSGDTSNWAMKLIPVTTASSGTTQPYTPTIESDTNGSFANYHIVPGEYTKVATFASNTDFTIGSSLQSTYQVYIDASKPAGTYAGKVKYTLVHPASMPIPNSTMLDTGQVVGAKMKTLAAGTETAYNAKTSDIKAIRMADELPAGFIPTEANTVSTSDSRHPIYIFYDNTNDAGIMYFYTGGYQVVMNPDSSHMFRSNLALADISGLATWDSSNVTNMLSMFVDSVVSLTNVDALSTWDTSRVEDMKGLFSLNPSTSNAGYHSSLTDISALANWDTSNVTDLTATFQNGASLTDISALVNWNTSKVTSMRITFGMGEGKSKTGDPIIDLSPLANWDVSNVTDICCMFQNNNIASFLPLRNWNVGKVQDFSCAFNQTSESTTTTLAGLENWNVSSATNMSGMFADSVSLTDASAINGWDVRNVIIGTGAESVIEGFNHMFVGSPVHPTFSLRPGTWNSNGTYIPSE